MFGGFHFVWCWHTIYCTVLYTKLQLNFVDFIKTALYELFVIMMYVEVPREIFSDIKRTSGSVLHVTCSMITFVSIATLLMEYTVGGICKNTFGK